MTGRILIVDDQKRLAESLKIGLERLGFFVDAFDDPENALLGFQAGNYDVAILDIRMPKLNGFELCRDLKKIDPATVFCFFTAFEIYQNEFETVFPDSGVKIFLKKPVSISELARQLNEILAEKAIAGTNVT